MDKNYGILNIRIDTFGLVQLLNILSPYHCSPYFALEGAFEMYQLIELYLPKTYFIWMEFTNCYNLNVNIFMPI